MVHMGSRAENSQIAYKQGKSNKTKTGLIKLVGLKSNRHDLQDHGKGGSSLRRVASMTVLVVWRFWRFWRAPCPPSASPIKFSTKSNHDGFGGFGGFGSWDKWTHFHGAVCVGVHQSDKSMDTVFCGHLGFIDMNHWYRKTNKHQFVHIILFTMLVPLDPPPFQRQRSDGFPLRVILKY